MKTITMKKLFILIFIISVSYVTADAQFSTIFNKKEGKYFKYSIGNFSTAAEPLFAIPLEKIAEMIPAEHQDPGGQWIDFTTRFIDKVLKKYFTIEEIRKMLKDGNKQASAHISLYFDYYGNIKYVNFIYRNDLKDLLSEEKLFNIYQGLIKLKIDTSGFYWWIKQKSPTLEQQKKLYGMTSVPFFFKRNCP